MPGGMFQSKMANMTSFSAPFENVYTPSGRWNPNGFSELVRSEVFVRLDSVFIVVAMCYVMRLVTHILLVTASEVWWS
jgi:hypothetical protein